MVSINSDRLKAMLGRLVQAALPRVDYLGHYRAKVNAQSSDGATLDVTPDDTRFPPMSKIPLRLGIPSAVAMVQVGAFVLVGFDGGDPSKPYCHLWDGGESVTKLVLRADKIYLGNDSGSSGVARLNDKAGGGSLKFTVVMGVGALAASIASIAILYTPGDGSTPQVIGPLTTGLLSGTVNIEEAITSASSTVNAK